MRTMRTVRTIPAAAMLAFATIAAPAQAASAPPAPAAQSVAARSGYLLGAGDKVRITVFGETNLTGEFLVNDAEAISYPLIGDIPVGTLTIGGLQETIRAKLADGFIDDPQVAAEIVTYRPFYILGEVAKPGAFPFVVGMTLQQAVAAAGGYTYRANKRRVFVRRPGEARETAVDLKDNPLQPVNPGDTLRIGERHF